MVGRELQRQLVYTTNTKLSLADFANVNTEDAVEQPPPPPPDSKDGEWAGGAIANLNSIGFAEMERKKALEQGLGKFRESLGKNLIERESVLVLRKPPELESDEPSRLDPFPYRLNAVGQERFVPHEVLRGKLPHELIKSYHFFREQTSDGEAHAGMPLMLRGYPIVDDATSRHVLLIELQNQHLHRQGSGERLCARVHKHFLDGSQPDLILLNLLIASTDLRSLVFVLLRLDELPHVLVWSKVRTVTGPTSMADAVAAPTSEEHSYAVDLIELPRLQLSLKGVGVKRSGQEEVLFRNGQQVSVESDSVIHQLSERSAQRTDPLFHDGDYVKLEGSTVHHVKTAHAVPRTDALFCRGDTVRVEANAVVHAATGVRLQRTDEDNFREPEEVVLSQLTDAAQRIGAQVEVQVGGRTARWVNVPAVARSSEMIELKGVQEVIGASSLISYDLADGSSATFSFINVANRTPSKATVTLHGLREEAGEIIHLDANASPPLENGGTFLNILDEEHWRLNVLELPHLYIYRPPGGVWPDQIRGEPVWLDEMPHGCVMISETRDLVILVRNLKLSADQGKLLPVSNDVEWQENVKARYFTYEVHALKTFLVTNSLASALYLCVMRFMCGNYTACFNIVDSIATTEPFTPEEAQIFQLFGKERTEPHLDAHHASACLCKVALAVQHAGVTLPFSLAKQVGLYVERLQHMSVNCRLTEKQELDVVRLARQFAPASSTQALLLENRFRYLSRARLPELEALVAAADAERAALLATSAPAPPSGVQAQKRAGGQLSEAEQERADQLHRADDLVESRQAALSDMRAYASHRRSGLMRTGAHFVDKSSDVLKTPTEAQASLSIRYPDSKAIIPVQMLRNGDRVSLDGSWVTHLATSRAIPRSDPLFQDGDVIVLRDREVLHKATGVSVPRTDTSTALFQEGDAIEIAGRNVIHLPTGRIVRRTDCLFRAGDQVQFVDRRVVHMSSGRSVPRKDALFKKTDQVRATTKYVIHIASGIAVPRLSSLAKNSPQTTIAADQREQEAEQGTLHYVPYDAKEEPGELLRILPYNSLEDILFVNVEGPAGNGEIYTIKEPAVATSRYYYYYTPETEDGIAEGSIAEVSGARIALRVNNPTDGKFCAEFDNELGTADQVGLVQLCNVPIEEGAVVDLEEHATERIPRVRFENVRCALFWNGDQVQVKDGAAVHLKTNVTVPISSALGSPGGRSGGSVGGAASQWDMRISKGATLLRHVVTGETLCPRRSEATAGSITGQAMTAEDQVEYDSGRTCQANHGAATTRMRWMRCGDVLGPPCCPNHLEMRSGMGTSWRLRLGSIGVEIINGGGDKHVRILTAAKYYYQGKRRTRT